jgi:hypothetical protein
MRAADLGMRAADLGNHDRPSGLGRDGRELHRLGVTGLSGG